LATKATEFGEITQNNGLTAVQGHSKLHDRIFVCLNTIPERDGQTDIRTDKTDSEQCGRAVKTNRDKH